MKNITQWVVVKCLKALIPENLLYHHGHYLILEKTKASWYFDPVELSSTLNILDSMGLDV